MKIRNFFKSALVALMILSGYTCHSQDRLNDVVYLKNGSVIKGSIIEFTPGKSLKIETIDKKQYSFTFDEIEKFVKEKPESLNSKTKTNEFRHVIKTDPLSYVIGYYKLMYEYKFSKMVSANLIAGYLTKDPLDIATSFSIKKSNGLVVSPELRFYSLPRHKDAPEGFYFAPWLRYEYQKLIVAGQDITTWNRISPTTPLSDVTVNVTGIGANLGIQVIASGFFALDFFAGCGYGFMKITGAQKTKDGYYEFVQSIQTSPNSYDYLPPDQFKQLTPIETHGGLSLRLGINLGVSF